MAGIYIHIPFCQQACSYCNFHFSTSLAAKEDVLSAILQEVNLQANYLPERTIYTLYFGGGTPSLLSVGDVSAIIQRLQSRFTFSEEMEITLEANPDDLTPDKLRKLKQTSVNRLSIGIQSFRNQDLRLMNRTHDAEQACQSIQRSREAGFHNLTIDLIYGTPTLGDQQWHDNLEKVVNMGIPHISAYALTVEPRTALHSWIKNGKMEDINQEQAARQFEILMDKMAANGYEHYEISNFAKPGFQARHNSSYWQGTPYLGLGPGAHSFNGTSRQWNVANNRKYAKSVLEEKIVPYDWESLSLTEQYNELLLTSLRTKWGCNVQKLQQKFPGQFEQGFESEANRLIDEGLLHQQSHRLVLTRRGTLLADHVIARLFV